VLFCYQVPLGAILKNENVNAEMIEIMESLHHYIPSKTTARDGENHVELLDSCLFGGDQLTCARARSAKRHRQDSYMDVDRLSGLQPVVEHLHATSFLFVLA